MSRNRQIKEWSGNGSAYRNSSSSDDKPRRIDANLPVQGARSDKRPNSARSAPPQRDCQRQEVSQEPKKCRIPRRVRTGLPTEKARPVTRSGLWLPGLDSNPHADRRRHNSRMLQATVLADSLLQLDLSLHHVARHLPTLPSFDQLLGLDRFLLRRKRLRKHEPPRSIPRGKPRRGGVVMFDPTLRGLRSSHVVPPVLFRPTRFVKKFL